MHIRPIVLSVETVGIVAEEMKNDKREAIWNQTDGHKVTLIQPAHNTTYTGVLLAAMSDSSQPGRLNQDMYVK